MNIDCTFKRNYEVESLNWIDSGPRYYYPGANRAGGRDGHIVRIIPFNAEQWIGIFEFGDFSRNGISGLFATPDLNKVCVLSRGVGYLVSTSDPSLWEKISCTPILGAIPVLNHNILIFSNYTELVAYDETGIKWVTERISFDSFTVEEITNDTLKGSFWDYQTESLKHFEVDLLTGHLVVVRV